MTTQTPQLHRTSPKVNLDVRSGPRTSYHKVAVIEDPAIRYEVLGKYNTGQSGDIGTWWQIRYSDSPLVTGWVSGDLVTTENVSGVSVTWQPYTDTLRTGSLALPFAEGFVFPITNLFDDLRTRDWYTRYGGGHNGIDWGGMKKTDSIHAMVAGRVAKITTGKSEKNEKEGLGNRVVVQSQGFRITYGHLTSVDVGENVEVEQGTRLGTAGQTGFSTDVHLHAQMEPDYHTEIPANHKHINGAVNFQQYLPEGIYLWPDIDALQNEISTKTEAGSKERAVLVHDISHRMDSLLRGTTKARLRVKPGAAVYLFPRTDEDCKYPGRPTPGVTIVGRDNAVWDLPHPYTDAIPTPDWWQIKGNSFPVCWVHTGDTEEIGDRGAVKPTVPLLPEAPPQYLQKPADTYVRTSPNTHIFDEEDGKLKRTTGNAILKRKIGNEFVWDTKGELVRNEKDKIVRIPPNIPDWVRILALAADETTGDYLWYKIPYHNRDESEKSNAVGWVRGDVVDVKSTLSENDTRAFSGDVYESLEKFPDCVTPQASTEPGQTVGARAFPIKECPTDHTFAGTAVCTGVSSMSPTWYQVQLSAARRGWVPADLVEVDHAAGLRRLRPQLRRRFEAPAVPVRCGPATGEAVLATLAADSRAWHALRGRDAVYPDWWQIHFDGTLAGWVHKDNVQTHGSLSGLEVTWGTVPQLSLKAATTAGLRVRSGPGLGHDRVGLIAGGSTTRYDILGKDAATAGWYQIRYSNTVVGWVHKDHVQTHGSLSGLRVTAVPRLSLKATVTAGLNVRSGPAATAAKVGFIAGGSTTRYAILGKDAAAATWYEIRYSATVAGWVHKNYVQTQGDLSGLGVTWMPQLSLKATATDGLDVHSGPATTHGKVGLIAGGSRIRCDILGKDAATAGWYQIRYRSAVTGWVAADDAVETGGNLNLAPPPEVVLADSTKACIVRSIPESTGTRVATIAIGSTDRYIVLGKDAATAAWYQIRYSDTGNGWVQASCVRLHGDGRNLPIIRSFPMTGAGPQLSLKAATTDGLNLRAGPGTGHRILLTLPFDATRYAILGKDAATAGWYQIRYSDTVDGWVHAGHVQTHGDLGGLAVTWLPAPQLSLKATVTLGLRVRSGPGLGHDKVGLIAGGSNTRYAILGKDAATAGWYQIRYSDTVAGWVHAGHVQTHGDLRGLRVTWVPQLSLKATVTLGLRVRSGPGLGHGRVGFIAGGSTTRYDILGKDATAANWYQIRFSATVTGWVHGDQVQTHGSLDGLTVTWVPQLGLKAATTNGLNVRSGPGTPHGKVGFITGGSTTRYDILGKDAAVAGWYQIRFSATVDGWVHKDYIQTHGHLRGLRVTWVPQLSLKATTTLGLNVRSGPGTGHDLVGFIGGGSTVRYDILGKDAATVGWYQIRYSPTIDGWVHKDYIQTHGNLTGLAVTWVPGPQLSLKATTTLGLNVRSGPESTAAKVGFISGGSTVRYDILGKDAATVGWYQIRYSTAVVGWVHANYVQTHGSLTGLAVTWVRGPQLSLKVTVTAGLKVRSGPGTGHSRVGLIAGGSTTRYDILGKDATTVGWYQIRFSDTVTGWVYANHVQTHGSLIGLAVTWVPQLSLKATVTLGLRVRSGPGRGHTRVGFIAGGSITRYDLLGKNAATATWYQIRYSSTVVGWVHANYVQTHGSLTGLAVTWIPQLGLKAVTTAGLNVRSGPGTGHAKVGFIAGGSTVRYDILGRNAAATWYQIRYSSTVVGWVYKNHVQTYGHLGGLAVTWDPGPQLSLKAATTAGLNVRSGPDTNHGLVGFITGGSTVRYDLLGKNAATATWYQIRYSGTVTGWVYKNHVQTHGSLTGLAVTWVPGPRLSLKVTVTTGLNVRSGPGLVHNPIGYIAGGSTTRYDILGKDAATAGWYQIRYSAAVTGWVYKNHVQTHGSLTGLAVTWDPGPQLSLKATTTAGLNVRSGPDTVHIQVGFIPGGSKARYDILGKDAATVGWYQIRYSDTIIGWVYKNHVQTHGSLTGLRVTWVSGPQLSLKAATTAGLNVRSGPGIDHGQIGFIAGGSKTRYNILGKDAATAEWYRIRYSNTIVGWVYASHVRTHGSLVAVPVR